MNGRLWLGAGTLLLAVPAAADLAEIKRAGVLRVVAVEGNTPIPGKSPFLAVEKGVASGFDAELLAGFTRAQGLKLSVTVLQSWERLVPSVLEGQADVAAGNVTSSDQRRKLIDFTIETLPTRVLLVSYPPAAPILSLAQLGAEKVGVAKGTSPHEVVLAAGISRANLDDSQLPGQLFEALRSGRVRVAAMELMAATEAQRRDPKVQLGLLLGSTGSLGFGVSKDAPRLLEALNAHISGLKSSPNWYRMLIANFGPSAPSVLGRIKTEKK